MWTIKGKADLRYKLKFLDLFGCPHPVPPSRGHPQTAPHKITKMRLTQLTGAILLLVGLAASSPVPLTNDAAAPLQARDAVSVGLDKRDAVSDMIKALEKAMRKQMEYSKKTNALKAAKDAAKKAKGG